MIISSIWNFVELQGSNNDAENSPGAVRVQRKENYTNKCISQQNDSVTINVGKAQAAPEEPGPQANPNAKQQIIVQNVPLASKRKTNFIIDTKSLQYNQDDISIQSDGGLETMEYKKISIKLASTKRKEPSPSAAESIFGSLDQDDQLPTSAELPPPSKSAKLASEDAISKSKRLQEEGNDFAERAKFHAALMKWDEALELTPTNAILYELKAQAFMQLEQFFTAIEWAERATKLDPAWPDAFLTLARAQINFGELELALGTLQKASKLKTENLELVQELRDEFSRATKLIQEKRHLESSGAGRVIRGRLVTQEERAHYIFFAQRARRPT